MAGRSEGGIQSYELRVAVKLLIPLIRLKWYVIQSAFDGAAAQHSAARCLACAIMAKPSHPHPHALWHSAGAVRLRYLHAWCTSVTIWAEDWHFCGFLVGPDFPRSLNSAPAV